MISRLRTVLSWCCRLILSAILLASALGKSLDLPGFVDVLRTYRAFPDWALWSIGLIVAGLEWLLGLWLLAGWKLRSAALSALMLNAAYAIWQTVTLLRGLDLPNCGCFGVFFPQPLRWYSPVEDLALAGMCVLLWKMSSDTRDERRRRFLGLGMVAVVLIGVVGGVVWFNTRYDESPDQTAPLQVFTVTEYPEDPEPRSRAVGTYRHDRLRIHRQADTRFRLVLEPATPNATVIELQDVDLAHLVAAVPSWLAADSNLRKISLIDREWNRQQISFRSDSSSVRIHPGGDGFETRAISRVDLARNCLNAGLWEVILFTVENGKDRVYEHIWFTFPLGLYKQLFEQVNGLSYWDYWWSLEHWRDPSGTPVPLERLRTVESAWPVEAKALWDEEPLWRGEQGLKRANVLTPLHLRTYRDWYTQSVQFASFIPPGRYSRVHPRETSLHYLEESTGATLRHVRLPTVEQSLAEIELSFKDSHTQETTRLIFGGLDVGSLPTVRPTEYEQGWQAPFGIGNPSFFETYEEVLAHPPRQRSFYGFHLDARDRWIDHHAVGVDGPLLFRDADNPSLIHLYLLAYERHALLNHFVISCPVGRAEGVLC